jgi:hypothetical protein
MEVYFGKQSMSFPTCELFVWNVGVYRVSARAQLTRQMGFQDSGEFADNRRYGLGIEDGGPSDFERKGGGIPGTGIPVFPLRLK